MNRRSRTIAKFGVGVFFVVGIIAMATLIAGSFSSTQTKAIGAWNAGMIIDDATFYNADSFPSVSAIQDFINSKTPVCDTWGTQPSEYGGGTRAQYAAARGWPGPPYVCLQNYYENPTTHETSFEKSGGAFAGGVSTAQIIWDVAHQYSINPQVLLVTLKKEQGSLYTDAWPLKSQYAYAMGYGCPDSGPNNSANCSSNYAGLYNQLRLAAAQFRRYATYPTQYGYQAGRTNYIQYSPDASCGGSWVYIQNQATANLYNYTPYQPNDAALAAYPGTASCGAYGNRNFWRYFDEWFGAQYIYATQKTALISRYQALGSATGVLGNPIGDVYCYTKNGDKWCVQRYDNGYILSGKYGAWESYGDIRTRWQALGFENGTLGYPRDEVYCYTKGTDQWCVQRYENGYVISGKYGTWESYGAIRDRWGALGYESGVLGYPRDGVYCYTKNGDNWCVQRYENGYILSGKYGAWESYGDIRNRWAALGYENGALGYPRDGVYCYTKGMDRWCVQRYENGYIINGKYGTWESYGDIRTRWGELGYENGVLGYPRDEVYCYTKGTDRWCVQRYENGYIISGKYGAWESYGDIRTRWAALGYENGALGYPTGPVMTTAIGLSQSYEGGTITYRSSDKSVNVTLGH